MLLRLHRAVFGVRENYHAALAASFDNRALLDEIRDRTDRPPDHLPGTAWQPFERGFVVREWYILCRTFPDSGALRGGMVKSFAVLAPVVEIAMVDDFTALAAQLPDDATLPWKCNVSEIEVMVHEDRRISQTKVPGLKKLAHRVG